jgi:hypothetical protein
MYISSMACSLSSKELLPEKANACVRVCVPRTGRRNEGETKRRRDMSVWCCVCVCVCVVCVYVNVNVLC